MTNQFEVEPAVLLEWAKKHEEIARQIIEWARIPTEWLREFPNGYGTIAEPVRAAVEKYFNARHKEGLRLADDHMRTARNLRHAAAGFAGVDDDARRSILHTGDDEHHHTDHALDTTSKPNASTPPPGGGGGQGPGGFGPDRTDHHSAQEPPATAMNPAVAGSAPNTAPGAHPEIPGATATPGTPLMTPAAAHGDERYRMVPGATGNEYTPPPITPFLAAVGAARDRATEPGNVVGDAVNEDLLLARTLLSALLAAVGSTAVGVSWAVSVMRNPDGAAMFVTSNDGRGWLPPTVYLPTTTSTPWNWVEFLDYSAADTTASWDGITDPARTLVEFGTAWTARTGAQLSALASSGTITPNLRTAIHDTAVAELVPPADELDLRVPTADTIDRLGLTGSAEALEHVATVEDSQIQSECLRLAIDAHTRWGHARGASDDATRAWRIREHILELIRDNEPVPQQWLQELRDIDARIATTVMTRRADVSGVPVGELRPIDDAVLHALQFERRCDEMVLLLTEQPTRQTLRDTVYAHEHLTTHPRFEALATSVAVAQPAAVPVAGSAAGVAAGENRTITTSQDTHTRSSPQI